MSIVLRVAEQTPPPPPYALCWSEPEWPLPRRTIRLRGRAAGFPAFPWLPTGPEAQPFDFCGHVRRLCTDIATSCAELRHIDASRVLFTVTQARKHRLGGLQARLTPLRCPGGQLTRRRHGFLYQVQRYFVDGREMLYLLTIVLPRFLDGEFDEKFITLFHELYHISPAFNGDLRRHEGRYAVHSHSQRAYDKHMAALAREYLARRPDPALHAFLRMNSAQLRARHGSVVGIVVPRPRLIPIAFP
ncbi:MAG TPA: hypothetical protein VFA18_11930 [Gemmataceae bacterium]|nr:hypothetical protein [Gemmataceae bacterium]